MSGRVEEEGMGGAVGQMGVVEMVGQMGMVEMLGQWVEGEVQEMKMEIHMEKAAVALGYCSPHSCVLDEQDTCLVNQHTQVGYLGTQVVVLNSFGLLGFYNSLSVGMLDKDPWTLQKEGSRCSSDPQQPQQDMDLQPHEAEGQERGLLE